MSGILPRVQGIPSLPVPPGQSGVHVKGSVYLGIWTRIARELPDGRARVLAALRDPAVAAFSEQIFLASGWYDALPVMPLMATIAELKGISFEQEVSHGARIRVTQDIHGAYRLVFRLASPDLVASRLPRAFGKYLDFGRAENTLTRSGEVEVVSHGIPEFLAPWFVHASAMFFQVALELSGARDVRLAWDPVEPAGRRGALGLVRIRVRATWR